MELLLNLAWLLLALPAYWIWRGTAQSSVRRRCSSAQCLLALGCLLVMLFPVVSATDDLHVMQAAVEESPVSKRSVRQASGDRASTGGLHSQSLHVSEFRFVQVAREQWYETPIAAVFDAADAATPTASRAPPVSLIG